MNESASERTENPNGKLEQRKADIIALAAELAANPEGFPFPGINPDAYARLKADEMPGYGTSIDTLVERFKNEGIKIISGENPESDNVFVLPRGSDDIENDSILAGHLDLARVTDENLRKLILLKREQALK